MSNDELQKAIDDITGGTEAGLSDLSAQDNSSDFDKFVSEQVAPVPVSGVVVDGNLPMPVAQDVSNNVVNQVAPMSTSVVSDTNIVDAQTANNNVGVTKDAAMDQIASVQFNEGKLDDLELDNIEVDALKELVPILKNLDLDEKIKFDICMKALKKTGDRTIAREALTAARGITDLKARGNALVLLIKKIESL